ncbi:MAG: ATP-dependent RecD-like DNA helicase [Anaerolineae bacterium]
MFLPENTLIEQAVELLEVDYDMVIAAVERAIREELVTVDILHVEEGEGIRAIYLPMYYASEVGTANRIRRLFNHSGSRLQDIRLLGLEAEIERIAAWNDISLTDQQQAAVKAAVVNKVSILTGGPGTGKTTTLRTLIDVLRHGGFTFALASPTGRAAKRLSEATGEPASTIHRLLGFSAQGGFAYDDTNPLNYDMVIVDEASMLDIILANALTRALDPRSHLLLVGDSDQLPSVGAGDVLRDLTASGHVPITRLNVIFRQGKGSTIIENAHRINAGLPLEPASDGDGNLFHFKIDDDAERAADLIVDVVANRIPQRFGFDPLDDVQVLIPMYRGPAGITAMNDRLQQALNRRGQTAETRLGDRVYRVGDKVIQTRNNYDKEVFNGDIGRIATIDFNEKMLMVNFEDGRQPVEYDWSETSELMHAYAISVHRSQGSEYPVVVMPVITQYYMLLQRNLLYTAVTRAKKLVELVGSEKAIRIAVGNDAVSRRYTALDLRLQPESHSDSRFRF